MASALVSMMMNTHVICFIPCYRKQDTAIMTCFLNKDFLLGKRPEVLSVVNSSQSYDIDLSLAG